MQLSTIVWNRLAFGPRPGDAEAFAALGADDAARLTAWVDAQLNPSAIDDSACDAMIAASTISTTGKSTLQLWAEHHNVQNADSYKPTYDVRQLKWLKAVHSKRQLNEVLVDFWHYHFNIYPWDDDHIRVTYMAFDREAIRANALGNFRAMLEQVAKSTSMLIYLDNYSNQVAGFNENWARELLELHTLGAENYLGVKDPTTVPLGPDGVAVGYVDDDVFEGAACFTGWRVNDNNWEAGVQDIGTFLAYDAWHDKRAKTFMGKRIASNRPVVDDGLSVLDILAKHPGTGRYIARKLARRLIGDNPPQSVIDAAAAVFTAQHASPTQIAQTVRVIVMSDAFKNTWGEKFKRPFEFVSSAVRALNASFVMYRQSWGDEFGGGDYDAMGMPTFGRRPPDGYPDIKRAWTNTNSMLKRWRFANALATREIDHRTDSNTQIKYGTDALPDIKAQTPVGLRTAAQLADFWINRLLGRAMASDVNRSQVVNLIAQGASANATLSTADIDERLPAAVGLILMSPDFQLK
jgi:uncharacterized protein (DUF1800 family)